jgi:hypothetical protein
MSGDHFHVHGPHDHELEHAAQHGANDPFSGRIAVITALLATVGALFSYQGGVTQVNAMLAKNDAQIKKTEASDQWNYYQAKSNKQNLAELSAQIVADDLREKYRGEVKRYETEKVKIKEEAEALEKESKMWDERSESAMHQHHRWAQATTVLQIAIGLSAIALLTRRNWLMRGVYALGAVGLGLGALAAAHI